MGTYHTIAQGEHLSQLANKYGFMDHRTIWDRPENSALKAKRGNPHVLFPGDRVFIPDKKAKQESVGAGQHHRFQIRLPTLTLRLALQSMDGSPLAGAACELKVDGESHPLTTNKEGVIEQKIRLPAQGGTLIVKAVAPFDLEVPIKIGHLDPVDELTGQIARLNNLGYFAGATDPVAAQPAAGAGAAKPDPDSASIDRASEQQFRSAVEEFQCDHALKVDGVCGPSTKKKLLEVHGS